MHDAVALAKQLAKRSQTEADTGFLLIAMLEGRDTASNVLRHKGLTTSRVRTALRALEPEPEGTFDAVVHKAGQIASSFRAKVTTPLHLLAALTSTRPSSAYRALEDFGLDLLVIHTHALRCSGQSTADRGSRSSKQRKIIDTRTEALPLPEPLQGLSAARTPRSIPAAFSESNHEESLSAHSQNADPPAAQIFVPTSSIIKMGRELENKQRRARAQRITGAHGLGSIHKAVECAPSESAVDPGAFQIPAKLFPLLASMGRNLTMEAASGRLDTIVGRAEEMDQMADVLNKRRANSPCLVGPCGVGKTAIVEGLASRLALGRIPGLENRIIIELTPSDLLSGTSLRGAMAEKLTGLRAEVAESQGRIILFFDEVHALLASKEASEAVAELKSALSRGELPCIAATSLESYRRFISSDPALARSFIPIEVNEPSLEDAVAIVGGAAPAYQAHHGVSYTPEAFEGAVRLSARYLVDSSLPDKAIGLLDLAGARARRAGQTEVASDDVAHVLAKQLGIPPEHLVATHAQRLLHLETDLGRRIVGHHHALAALGETLRRNAAGFRTGRPIGSFLFLGPTGVGKTETAKALANVLFPADNAMIRLDMSEFSESHAVARLVGAPPGYIGHDEGGQLTEAVRKRPYSVILLDEIEKAHRDVLQVLLQVLDDGRLTDGSGKTVSFINTLIIMTSNLGSDLRRQKRRVGFANDEAAALPDIETNIAGAARAALPPELWNRIDEPLVFAPLRRFEVEEIAGLMLSSIAQRLREEHHVITHFTKDAIEAMLSGGGYDQEMGARPMRRTIQRMVEGPIAKKILAGEVGRDDVLTVDAKDGALDFAVGPKAAVPAAEGVCLDAGAAHSQ